MLRGFIHACPAFSAKRVFDVTVEEMLRWVLLAPPTSVSRARDNGLIRLVIGGTYAEQVKLEAVMELVCVRIRLYCCYCPIV